jgi:hypothetical protein
LKPVIRLKSIKNYSQPHSKNTKTPLQSPIGYAVQKRNCCIFCDEGRRGGGGCVLTGIMFFITGEGVGGDKKIYCSEVSETVAARPSGKDKPKLM